MSSAIYCSIFVVDDEHMNNYPNMLVAKLPVIAVLMIVVPYVIPTNEQIANLADKLREEHIQKQNSHGIDYRAKYMITSKADDGKEMSEGGENDQLLNRAQTLE